MFRDEEVFFPMAARSIPAADGEGGLGAVPPHEAQSYANDDFDDVFGSEPGTPSLPSTDRDRDFSGLDLSSLSSLPRDGLELGGRLDTRTGNDEISDIPRLKEKHETEGYRDGITKGKGQSVQEGFDEGYGLGAGLGLRVGWLLGVLEGVLAAVRTAAGDATPDGQRDWQKEKGRLEDLHTYAREELSTQSVFASKYWGEDGIWRFEVPGEKEGKEVLFPDVVEAHPLVGKWKQIIEEEVKRWAIDTKIFEGEEGHEEGMEGLREKEKQAKPTKEAVEEAGTVGNGKILGVAKEQLSW